LHSGRDCGAFSGWLNSTGTIPAHSSRMRLFCIPLVIAFPFAVDRAYMDGQNADQLMSLARPIGAYIAHGVDDLLRPLRR
jgi:hypothetical protein